MKDFDLFLAEKVTYAAENTNQAYTNRYKRIITYFPENKQPIEYAREDFLYILSQINAKSVGNFTVTKCLIADIFEWLIKQGEMTNEQLREFMEIQFYDLDHTDKYTEYYFRSFDQLHSTLEEIIEIHSQGNELDGEFDTLRCAIYLSWYGFTIKELIEILKEDINPTQPIIYKGTEKTPVHIGEKCMSYVREYAEKEAVLSRRFGRADGTLVRYKDSRYLFRSCKSEKLNENQITAMTRYTNPYVEEVGKKIAFGKIYQSGIYYRIYLDELENGTLNKNDFERMAKYWGLSSADLQIQSKKYDLSLRKYQQYQEYKKAFYNN